MSKESGNISKASFVENEIKIIKYLMHNENGASISQIAGFIKVSRQLVNHHLKNGLKGVVARGDCKKWVLQPAFYRLDTMATFLQPFIIRSEELYEGPDEEFEKYLSLLLAVMTVEI